MTRRSPPSLRSRGTRESTTAARTCGLHVSMLAGMATLQVRDVPDDVRHTLKRRAATAGQSLSEYVLGELSRIARQPTLDELTDRVRARGSAEPPTRAADILRDERRAG